SCRRPVPPRKYLCAGMFPLCCPSAGYRYHCRHKFYNIERCYHPTVCHRLPIMSRLPQQLIDQRRAHNRPGQGDPGVPVGKGETETEPGSRKTGRTVRRTSRWGQCEHRDDTSLRRSVTGHTSLVTTSILRTEPVAP